MVGWSSVKKFSSGDLLLAEQEAVIITSFQQQEPLALE
jgi:hypothetical protein